MRNALTIDLEDWYHPELVRPVLAPDRQEPQIAESAGALLDLLRARHVKATFFVVGEVARNNPDLIRTIADEGHELACHGMSHRTLWQMTPEELRSDLAEFAQLMGKAVPGVEIVGYRAPTFSLDNSTRWALTVLLEMGYHYDSSIFPLKTPLYGVAGGPLEPYYPSLDDVATAGRQGPAAPGGDHPRDCLLEFPMSVCSWAGMRIPVCGGVYLRVLPFGLILRCLRQINRQRPFVVYVHPWETYPRTPRLELPLPSRWATYYNIEAVMPRLASLLDQFSFAPMRTVLQEMEA